MFRGRCSCAISVLPTPSSTQQNPLSPTIPTHTVHSPVTPIIPTLTQNPGGEGSKTSSHPSINTLRLFTHLRNVGAPTLPAPTLVAPAPCWLLGPSLGGRSFSSDITAPQRIGLPRLSASADFWRKP